MRQVKLFRRQSARPAHTLSAPPGRPYPRLGSFADQLALELGKGGEHAKDQPPLRARRVDRCTLAGQHFEADPAPLQIIDDADQLRHGPAKLVELPDMEHIT